MLNFAKEGKSVSIIIDVSMCHAKNDERNIDVLKNKILELRKKYIIDNEDSLYIYDPFDPEPMSHIDHATQTNKLMEYNCEVTFNLYYAIKQSVYLFLAEDYIYDKYIIIFSDRIKENKFIKKGLRFNNKELAEANFLLITFGSKNNLEDINEIKELNFSHIHFEDVNDIEMSFLEEGNYGNL